MTNELSHHGILGMRWGIRRYQPYPSGHKGGKEVGEAAKPKKRRKFGARIILSKPKPRERRFSDPEEAKKDAIRSGDAKKIKKYAYDMTRQELSEAVDRMRNINAINKQIAEDDLNSKLAYKVGKSTLSIGKMLMSGLKTASAIDNGVRSVENLKGRFGDVFKED